MSELSTVAIKDGHRGHLSHSHHNPMDAERADRISRLAGLDRMANPRPNLTPSTFGGSNSNIDTATGLPRQVPTQAYFDGNNAPQITRERSTVGSASATGSVGGRTTWASGSNDGYGGDQMSEDMEVDSSSMGGFSDEGAASLVGFGEGARTPARQLSGIGSPMPNKSQSGLKSQVVPQQGVEAQKYKAKMLDGMNYDGDGFDTANRTPPPVED